MNVSPKGGFFKVYLEAFGTAKYKVAYRQKINKNKAEEYIQQYRSIIEKYKNYLEVFSSDGRPYKSLFYYCDEGMLWAVNFLEL